MAIRRTLRPIRPSAALAREYQKQLDALIDKMNRSFVWWTRAAYRKKETQIVGDESPSRFLERDLSETIRDWLKEWNKEADRIARHFAKQVSRYVRNGVDQSIKGAKLGPAFTVNFKYMSRRERDVLQSIIIENVNLIKSIPAQYATQVTGIVQRGVQNNRDVVSITEELHKRYEITKRRARNIARDQTAKATEGLSRARMMSLGIEQGEWIHTSAGKTYRQTHVEFDGQIFDLNVGLFDEEVGYNVKPAELPACHCTFRPVVPTVSGASG